jgi:uncharacterized membrane protein
MSDDARMGFAILQVMRLSGAALAVFGLAVVAGKIALPQFIGVGLIVIGAVESLVVPAMLARSWKRRG